MPRTNGEEEEKCRDWLLKKDEESLSSSSASSKDGSSISSVVMESSSDGGRRDVRRLSDAKGKEYVSLNDVEDSPLRKLLRDLNRCDVSIRRYQNTLQQVSN